MSTQTMTDRAVGFNPDRLPTRTYVLGVRRGVADGFNSAGLPMVTLGAAYGYCVIGDAGYDAALCDAICDALVAAAGDHLDRLPDRLICDHQGRRGRTPQTALLGTWRSFGGGTVFRCGPGGLSMLYSFLEESPLAQTVRFEVQRDRSGDIRTVVFEVVQLGQESVR